MSENNKAIVKQINADFVGGNYEKFLSSCAENVVWTIIGEKPVKGREAIRQWMASTPLPPQITIADPVIAEGDFVVSRGNMTMKDKDGKTGSYSYCDIYRFRDNKIVELNTFIVKNEPKSEATSGA